MADGNYISNKQLADGVRLSSQVNKKYLTTNQLQSMTGVYIGMVLEVLYPEDDANSTGKHIEVGGFLIANGTIFKNAPIVGGMSNTFDQDVYIPKAAGKPTAIEVGSKDPAIAQFEPGNFNGERVLVMFVNGNANCPIVIGMLPHDLYVGSPLPAKARGRFKKSTFAKIDRIQYEDGSYEMTIPAADKANVKGDILIDLTGTKSGNVTVDATGATSGNLTFKSKSFKIEMTSTGITITTTGATPGSKITFDGVKWDHKHATPSGTSGPPINFP